MVKKKREEIKRETIFRVKKPLIPTIPELTERTKFDVRYPLITPYAKAHIFWDDKKKELFYEVEQPKLNEEERKVLKILEGGLNELINISFLSIKTADAVIAYLEKNLKVLIDEFNLSVSRETFLKLMYYVYRDFVGLEKIEPLMNDYYIEDVECNGSNTPLYIVHRKYGNLRTNVIFKTNTILTRFVEKLAQKCGKYISYATPLLDAKLPDGSRVNATYTQEISSRGPTFTIRKFTKEPWTPVKLMDMRTVSPEMLAYLWLLIEHEANIMVIGGTGSGKCVIGDTPVYLPNGKKINIEELVEKKLKKGKLISDNSWEFCGSDGTEILSLNLDTLKVEKKKISKFWKHNAPKILYKVSTRSGREIITTGEHPFFILNEGQLEKIRADKLDKAHRIAIPRRIVIDVNKEKINLIDYIKDQDCVYVFGVQNHVRKIFGKLIKKFNLKNESQLALKYGFDLRRFYCWKKENSVPLKVYCKLADDAHVGIKGTLKLKAKTTKRNKLIRLPDLSPKLFRFLGMVLSDGHLRKNYVEFHNSNNILLNDFIKLGKVLFGLDSRIEDYKYRTKRVRIYSPVIARLLNKAFEIPIGKKAKIIKIPSLLFERNNNCVEEFVSGVIDCEGHVNETGVEIGMSSDIFLDELVYLFNRLGIVARRTKRRISVSGFENVKLLKEIIPLKNKSKYLALANVVNRRISRLVSNVDLIPNVSGLIKKARISCNLTQNQFSEGIGVSRRLVGMWENSMRNPSFNTFSKLANFVEDSGVEEISEILKVAKSDIFWDEIVKIDVLRDHNEKYVYDLTIEENHNFLAGNIPIIAHNTTFLNSISFFIPPASRIVSIEDTRELNLLHENWLPSVIRETATGKSEISLFTLLKESFRQRPDYVIVGEVRGKEAYVLFQGMNAGHPSFGTMHAENVETMIRRLESPPIELSPALVESLDAVCVMVKTRIKGKTVRRIKHVAEVVKVSEALGRAELNMPFTWDPKTDRFYFKTDSKVFDKISVKRGISKEELLKEFNIRARLLLAMYKNKIFGFKEVQDIINAYYKDVKSVLKQFKISLR